MNNIELGSIRADIGKFGKWTLREHVVTEKQAFILNLRNSFQDLNYLDVKEGIYTCLEHQTYGVVMSNTPMEVKSNQRCIDRATGDVLIMGLGMGMVLEALIKKPEIQSITVVELDEDVINYIGAYYKDEPKVKIMQGDCNEYQPQSNEFYNYIWFDIWAEICSEYLDEMKELHKRFKNNCDAMDFWSIEFITGNIDYFKRDI